MDEVAGYLPPTANPPTKQPIMLLMKQARAFGLGVVLSTQNPVDVDYKAISNAGTWMVGRLQTERDKQRLLDGMSAAAGTVDVGAVGDTISGLAKREFVLRRAGKDQPEVFTTRWAMSYLRGPMTRDQIELVMRGAVTGGRRARRPTPTMAPPTGAPLPAPDAATAAPPPPAPAPADPDATPVMPEVGGGVAVRWVDPAAPWLGRGRRRRRRRRRTRRPSSPGSRCATTTPRPTSSTTRSTRRCCTRSPSHPDVTTADRRRLRRPRPARRRADAGRLPAVGRADRRARRSGASCPRTSSTTSPAAGRWRSRPTPRSSCSAAPARRADEFAARCRQAAADKADEDTAKLRTKYEAKVGKLQSQIAAAESAADVAGEQQKARQRDDLLSSAGSILGGLLGGRKSTGGLLGQLGRAAGRTGKTSAAGPRVDAAQGKVARLEAQLQDVEAELAQELTEIGAKWDGVAAADHDDVDPAREVRRQGHPARAGVAPRAVVPLRHPFVTMRACRANRRGPMRS